MGKKARKTRWRALEIADDHSDSEESNTNSSAISGRYPNSYGSSAYHSKYSYSSQSTPARRRYQYDGSTKSTRSSSTTSENKITFNEDEYTRITTPRQDVLFKKGYLNKPKSYQTQTSTGNSTISTGYSTENGTPDHQSSDLDYESQFVFPNGFVDQNGIYYVNSYEPYPLMLFNPPTYYSEFSNIKSKRYSTGSLSESMSPNNEESASQDHSQSGGEASNSVSDYSVGGPPVYNMVFPGYYVNSTSPSADLANDHHHHHHPQSEPVKKLKKRRERKSSKTVPGDSSENTDDNSSDENRENTQKPCISSTNENSTPTLEISTCQNDQRVSGNNPETSQNDEPKTATDVAPCDSSLTNSCADTKTEIDQTPDKLQQASSSQPPKESTLKPDAEEFIPRVYQLGPPPQIKVLTPNLVPIPLLPINDFGGSNFNGPTAFIPSGFPINFIPHHPRQKMFPPVPGFVNFAPPMVYESKIEEIVDRNDCEENERDGTATPFHTPVMEEAKPLAHNKTLDMATVVSKLEEAAKLQEKETIENNLKGSPKFNKFSPSKRNYYRNPSGRHGDNLTQRQNGESKPQNVSDNANVTHPAQNISASEKLKHPDQLDEYKRVKNSPERFRRNWKPNGYQDNKQNVFASPKRQHPILNNNKNYSETLKKTQNTSPVYPAQPRRPNTNDKSIKVGSESATKSKITRPKQQNQWISVSSRKKKKNRNVEEYNFDEEELPSKEEDNSELFESYDVSQLVDVVPDSKQSEQTEKNIGDILTDIAQKEAAEVQQTPTDIPEVSEIEKNIIIKIEEQNIIEEITVTKIPDDEKAESKEHPSSDVQDDENFKLKKSKKGTQKPLTKKVIITDIDLSMTVDEIKPPVTKVAKKNEELQSKPNQEDAKDTSTEQTEKKSKKKKKKSSKPTMNGSLSGSNLTLNVTDDSYDFLLEDEIVEKTNDEISVELDKLIQKGMFSSLHDKIKSVDVETQPDEFFKTFQAEVPPSKDKISAVNGFMMKTPDFNRIFQSTRQFLKPNMTLPIRALDLF